MRPVGGIVLGLYADRAGRKAALMMVIGLMTIDILMLAIAAALFDDRDWRAVDHRVCALASGLFRRR